MTTMQEFKSLPRLSIKTISGWASSVSCNTPTRCVKAQIIYTTKSGDRRVFGEATAKSKNESISAAWEAALSFYNEE